MNLNYILELLRASMLSVIEIKNAVLGHVYSSYLNNASKFPCITMFFITGGSPVHISGSVKAVIQAKIWTDSTVNPYRELYEIYDYIIQNFHQKYKEDDNVKMMVQLGRLQSDHPPVILEKYNNIDLYSLAAKIHCTAIYV